jgi:hypothetical protein
LDRRDEIVLAHGEQNRFPFQAAQARQNLA